MSSIREEADAWCFLMAGRLASAFLLFVVAVGMGCSRTWEVRPGPYQLDPQSVSQSRSAKRLLNSRLILGDNLEKAAIETAEGESVVFRLERVPENEWPEGPRHMAGSIRLQAFRSSPEVLRLGDLTLRDLVVHAAVRTGTSAATSRKPVIAKLVVVPDGEKAELLTINCEPVPTGAERLDRLEPAAGSDDEDARSSTESGVSRCDLAEMRKRHPDACCIDAHCGDGKDCNKGVCETMSCDVCLSDAVCPAGSKCVENEEGCRVCQSVE